MEALYERGKFYYDYLIDMTTKMYDLLPSKYKQEIYEDNKEIYLMDIHIAIQAVLLKIAYVDGEFNPNELLYIDKLTPNNTLEFILQTYLEEKGMQNFSFETLLKMDYDSIDTVFQIVDDFLVNARNRFLYAFNIVNMNTRKNYEKVMLDCLYSITNCLSISDNESDAYEQRRIKEIVEANFILEKGVNEQHITLTNDLSYQVDNINLNCSEILKFEDDINKAIVYIETNCSSGTGFLINNQGDIITCSHVVNDSEFINVMVNENNKKVLYHGVLKKYNQEYDYAVIKIEKQNTPFLEVETNFNNLKNNAIAIVGFPYGRKLCDELNDLSLSITRGFISSIQSINHKLMYFLDANAFHGNSGGPVFDIISGKVIGLLIGAINPSDKMVYMHTLEQFLIQNNKGE